MQEERQAKLRVALIAGGTSHEREVSLNGAAVVEKMLDHNKYIVTRYDSATDLAQIAINAENIDFAFIVLHGTHGEDGTMQGFLDLLGIPYQGPGVLGSALAMDKNIAKERYQQSNLPIAAWTIVQAGDASQDAKILEKLKLPVVVKPALEGSSIGISIAHTKQELTESLTLARKYTDKSIMVEQFIKGRELTCAVLGNSDAEALPVLEIVPGEGYEFFDYEAKYLPGASNEICPALITDEVRVQVQEYAVAAHHCLQLQGCSRTDFLFQEDGQLFLLETNTIPGMTETSILPQEAAAAGMDYSQLLDRLIELGLQAGS